MAIETTRRGFMILLGALAAAGALKTESLAPTQLTAEPRRFGYRVFKDGKEFFRWIDGDAPVDFEFEVSVDSAFEVSANFLGPARATRTLLIPDRYFHLEGHTFVVHAMMVKYDEVENIDWLEVSNVTPYDPERDLIRYAIGSLEPIVIRGV
jgi:hypothetical protein